MSAEQIEKTTFRWTGGANLGWLFFGWPLVKLLANADGLRISCLGQQYLLPRNNIQRLSRQVGLFSTGLRIEHSVQSVPQSIVFWYSFCLTSGFDHLCRQLEDLGFKVHQWESSSTAGPPDAPDQR
jgi:hypothetical protein